MTPTFPFAFAPIPGESPDGWLLAFCNMFDLTLSDMQHAWGLTRASVPMKPRAVAVDGLTPELVSALDAYTRIDTGPIQALVEPARRYRGGLEALRLKGSRQRTVLTDFDITSRYCPSCLAEQGRWQAKWRLGWLPACDRHRTFLVATCPDCGARQGNRPFRWTHAPTEPFKCAAPAPGQTGRAPRLCEADLRNASTCSAPEEIAELGESWSDPRAAADLAKDLIVLLRHLNPSALEERDLTSRPQDLAELLAPAVKVLADTSGQILTSLAQSDLYAKRKSNGRSSTGRKTVLPRSLRGGSDRLNREVMRARADLVGPITRLRWSAGTRGRAPNGGALQAAQFAQRLPAALWPEWAARLLPVDFKLRGVFPSMATVALLLPGSTLRIGELVTLSSNEESWREPGSFRACLEELAATPHGQDVLSELERLAETLDPTLIPVDYGRRRQVFAEGPLISSRQWSALCRRSAKDPGRGVSLECAHVWLWTRLTGGPPRLAPRTGAPASSRRALSSFLRVMDQRTLELLDEHANDMLWTAGIRDEPLSWAPPIPPDATVPGVDLNDEHAATRIQGALRSNKALGAAARDIGMNLDHLMFALLTSNFCYPGVADSPGSGGVEAARALLQEGASIRQTSLQLGLSRRFVTLVAWELGVPRPPGRTPVYSIDPGWLRVEYIQHGRSYADIAAEVGCSPGTIARIASANQIIRRRPGHPALTH